MSQTPKRRNNAAASKRLNAAAIKRLRQRAAEILSPADQAFVALSCSGKFTREFLAYLTNTSVAQVTRRLQRLSKKLYTPEGRRFINGTNR